MVKPYDSPATLWLQACEMEVRRDDVAGRRAGPADRAGAAAL